jgi:hypothetical protein
MRPFERMMPQVNVENRRGKSSEDAETSMFMRVRNFSRGAGFNGEMCGLSWIERELGIFYRDA